MRYKEYKKVNLPWLDQVPSHWEIQRLKNVAAFINGFAFKSSDFTNQGTIIIRISDFSEFGITNNLKSLVYYSNDNNSLDKYEIRQNDILICLTGGTVGKTYQVRNICNRMLINQRVAIIRALDIIDYSYLNLLFKSDLVQNVINLSKNSLNDNISTSNIGNIFVPYPPKEEQEQIARFLDWKISEIDRLIEIKKKKINELDKAKQLILDSYYDDLNGDKVKLKYCGNFITSGNISRSDEVDYSKYKALLYGDIYTKYNFSFNECKTMIDEQVYYKSPKTNKNTLFFTTSGETREEIGKCVVYLGTEDIAIGGDLVVFKPNDDINSQFLMYSLNTSSAINYRYIQARGEIIIHISESKIANYEVKIPTIEQQDNFVKNITNRLNNVELTKNKVYIQIENLQLLKQSLISDAVTGRIDVRNIDIPTFEQFENEDMQEEKILEKEEE